MQKSYLNIFTKYVKDNYDIKDPVIYEKYCHSLRVATLMIYLSLKLGLNNDDLLLAFKIGLLHDLGRFREVVRNKDKERKLDNLSFDHGAYSNKILYNDKEYLKYDIDKNDELIVRKALYFHNKKEILIDNNLNERELMFINMIRDMDKLDILFTRSMKRPLVLSDDTTKEVINAYLSDEMIDIKDLHNDTDRVIFYLSFIKDLNIKESFIIAVESGYFERLLSLIVVKDNSLYDELLEKIYYKKKDKRKIMEI